jgi:hypothetical protein
MPFTGSTFSFDSYTHDDTLYVNVPLGDTVFYFGKRTITTFQFTAAEQHLLHVRMVLIEKVRKEPPKRSNRMRRRPRLWH